ncbi:MAG: hypothetical protein JSV25_00530 [Spirochaetota bacterium]|nr:MAG: hypothetical protein JSV25_00530 [Spirochaetota bacterium]
MLKKRVTIILFVALLFLVLSCNLFAQDVPKYSFISFERGYNDILSSARNEEYSIKEEEVNSSYGMHLVTLEKAHTFYKELLTLFFNEKRELIFYTVSFELYPNHSKRIIDKLITSLEEKFENEYGPSENITVPYYRVVEGQYEVFLKPYFEASTAARVSFKHLESYREYNDFYNVEIESEENEEIQKTIDKF